MQLYYTAAFQTDLERVYDFLSEKNPAAASRAVWNLRHTPEKLLAFPRIGQRLAIYQPREVRRLLIGPYELRYEIADDAIYLLNLWHGRENRPWE